MTVHTAKSPGGAVEHISPAAPTLPMAEAALDALAARFRSGGMMLALLRNDGSLAFHDAAATGMFFQAYVVPLLQLRAKSQAAEIKLHVAQLTPDSGVSTCNSLPGVTIAAFPYVERKQVAGVIALMARSDSFELGEDLLRVCGQLSIDSTWLKQQAQQLPGYGAEAIQSQARLLVNMVRDQVRLGGLEREIDSLSAQLANTYEELSLIYQLSSGMRINRRASDFFRQACVDVMEVINVRGMGVALRDENLHGQEPVLYGSLNVPKQMVVRLAEGLTPILEQRKTPLLVNDLSADKHFNWLSQHAKQLLAVPLQRQDKILGCMFALDKHAGEFDTVDSKLLNSIANESAIYLENAMLYEDVRGLMMGLLHSLTSAVDAKDTYTCGHSERVALLSRYLALQIHLDDHAVERVYMAGLLHDVGKIGVPEAVLRKTGKLTDEEFDEIKKHPAIGARILRDVKQIEDIIPGVLHHHERYDGKGYPAGLAGEAIPLMGRIICLADCFDAMTSSRTYRKALPLETALAEIKRCSGTQFDPKLTDAFLQISADQFRDLLDNHQEQAKKLIDMQKNLRAV